MPGINNIFYEILNTNVYMYFSAKSDCKIFDVISLSIKRSMGRTLWIWDTLPQKGIKSEDQTWINEGDAVENVHRLTIGNNYKTNNQGKVYFRNTLTDINN